MELVTCIMIHPEILNLVISGQILSLLYMKLNPYPANVENKVSSK